MLSRRQVQGPSPPPCKERRLPDLSPPASTPHSATTRCLLRARLVRRPPPLCRALARQGSSLPPRHPVTQSTPQKPPCSTMFSTWNGNRALCTPPHALSSRPSALPSTGDNVRAQWLRPETRSNAVSQGNHKLQSRCEARLAMWQPSPHGFRSTQRHMHLGRCWRTVSPSCTCSLASTSACDSHSSCPPLQHGSGCWVASSRFSALLLSSNPSASSLCRCSPLSSAAGTATRNTLAVYGGPWPDWRGGETERPLWSYETSGTSRRQAKRLGGRWWISRKTGAVETRVSSSR